jgi:hypothetical protein
MNSDTLISPQHTNAHAPKKNIEEAFLSALHVLFVLLFPMRLMFLWHNGEGTFYLLSEKLILKATGVVYDELISMNSP